MWWASQVFSGEESLPTEDASSIPGSEDACEKEMATTRVFLLEKSYGQRSLVVYCPQVCKKWDMTEPLSTNNVVGSEII